MNAHEPPSRIAARLAHPRRALGLSGRLLFLTVAFVMLAEVLIYAPSVANFRANFLRDRWAVARVATMVLQAAPDGAVPRELELSLLAEIGADTVAMKTGDNRSLIAASDKPPVPVREHDLRDSSPWRMLYDAFATLLSDGEGRVRVIGAGMAEGDFIELVYPEKPLRDAMWRFSVNILILSLMISAITAALVFLALRWLIVRPVQKLSDNVTAFAADPESKARIIRPSGRGDEIGAAEVALRDMQENLSQELRTKKHLAALGLAVSKINHDLRNMLAAAQLMSDRLAQSDDPVTHRFAPRLIATLDRAIAFCQATLAYGRAAEREPQREALSVAALAREAAESVLPEPVEHISIVIAAPDEIRVLADREHMHRILSNLVRNAVQALPPAETGKGEIRIVASRAGRGVVIDVIDNGPGVPEKARAKLFEAFTGSARAGGTGLGLAIVAELVRLNQGRIELAPSEKGAHFRIVFQEQAAV